jgi:alanine dehydrogenase
MRYRAAGVEEIVAHAEVVRGDAELVLQRFKEPIDEEYPFFCALASVLFSPYLHLAANGAADARALDSGVRAGRLRDGTSVDDGSLPLLGRPGAKSPAGYRPVGLVSASRERRRGVLLGGASRRAAGESVHPRGRHRGRERVQGAVGVGAHVSILDVNPARPALQCTTFSAGTSPPVMSNRANIEEEVARRDLAIGRCSSPAPALPAWFPLVSRAAEWVTARATRRSSRSTRGQLVADAAAS